MQVMWRRARVIGLIGVALWLGACDDPATEDGSVVLVPEPEAEPEPTPEPEPDAEVAPPPDAEVMPDLAPLDRGPLDMAPPDMGPTSDGLLCDPCNPDGSCAEGGICLTNQNTGEQFCGSACVTNADCPRGSSCFDLGGGTSQCAPVGATCADFPPPDLLAPCADDDGCNVDADTCVPAGDASYCSVGCAEDADCPPGVGRCRDGLCRANWELGPEGCGRDPTAALAPCADGGACGAGLTCADAILELPPTVAPFCTRECAGDADCPAGSRCAQVSPLGGVEDGPLSICVDTRCDCLARPADQALLDEALELAGLDRCSAGFERGMFALLRPDVAHDPFRLSFFDPAHRYGYGGLVWAREIQRDLDARAEGPQPAAALIERGAAVLDAAIDGAPRVFEAGGDAPLVEALAAAVAAAEGPALDRAAVTAAFAPVPAALRRDLARVVRAMAPVIEARAASADAVGLDAENRAALYNLVPGTMIVRPDFTTIDMRNRSAQRLLNGGFDLGPIFAASRDLAATIEAIDWALHRDLMGFAVSLDTPLGRVIINDGAAQQVEGEGGVFLLLDAGGDDVYHAPVGATANAEMPVAVALDLGGDDRYGFAGDDAPPEVADLPPADAAGRYDGSHPQVADGYGPISSSVVARQGSGILGTGLLFDLAGDDTYLSHRLSQGAAVLGVGGLIDRDGADRYACEQGCQGAASYGLAFLVDSGAGNDRYLGVQSVQGFAYVRAFGYLHDSAGDDVYRALFGDPELEGAFMYPNSQNATSNTSLAQGAGFGRRADFTDQVFASGGLGVFRDGDGFDRYQVDVFGQGTGFWFGTGLFSDGGGDDNYEGRWYVQGSGAHFAMSFFFEEGGNDRYNRAETMLATAVGQGHDMSLGWLIDYAGDDTWIAPGLGLGGGNDNGIGVFVDLRGADTYVVPDGRTFGGANIGDRGAAFESALCLGVFIDADGVDVYEGFEAAALVGNDRDWSWDDRRPEHKPGEHGAGLDVTAGRLSLP